MTAELAVITSPDEIASLPDDQRSALITRALVESKSWLAVATKGTDPTPIAEFKAWIATVAEMTKQKDLAKDIQLDALEMVRRAERGIGQAMENGKAAGEIATRQEAKSYAAKVREARRHQPGNTSLMPKRKPCPTDFVSTEELTGNGAGIVHLTNGVTDEQFETALDEARTEGNLSRANVVRKIKDAPTERLSRYEKSLKIREMAELGYTSRQMSESLGTAAPTLRDIARQYQIEIPADTVTARTRHIDPARIVNETVHALQGIEFTLNLLTSGDYDGFTPDQISDWLGALQDPTKAVRNLMKELNARA